MHNIISNNQLNEWGRIQMLEEENTRINDYYECIIECDEGGAACKRICKEILV
jgi:hypothetical protein